MITQKSFSGSTIKSRSSHKTVRSDIVVRLTQRPKVLYSLSNHFLVHSPCNAAGMFHRSRLSTGFVDTLIHIQEHTHTNTLARNPRYVVLDTHSRSRDTRSKSSRIFSSLEPNAPLSFPVETDPGEDTSSNCSSIFHRTCSSLHPLPSAFCCSPPAIPDCTECLAGYLAIDRH